MTRDEAAALLRNFFQTHGATIGGLNEHGFGGAMIGSAEIYFQHEVGSGALVCRALIHKFDEEIDRRIVRAFEQIAKAGEMDTGGGQIEYMPENRGIYLSRTYTTLVSDSEFAEDVQRLASASLLWAHEGLERAAAHLSSIEHPSL